jgi:hypothetical protein
MAPLQRLKSGISDANSGKINWKHSPADIAEGVEVVFAALTASEKEGEEKLKDMFELLEQIAELAGEAYVWPVKLGELAIMAELFAIGAGYEQAAEKIKNERSATGFCRGVVMGVMATTPPYIKENFWEWSPEFNAFWPEGGKIAQNYYDGGLVLGYDNGRELQRTGLGQVFFSDFVNLGDANIESRLAGIDPAGNWSDKDWSDFYVDIGVAFRRLHVTEDDT